MKSELDLRSAVMKSNLMHRLIWSCIAGLLLVAGCKAKAPAPSGKLQIVATTGMIADVVRIVAAGEADVTGLMGSGVDPHLYKASHGDVQKLDAADIVFYNGLHLEGKMADVLEKMARVKPVSAVAEAVPESLRLARDGNAESADPHVWMDPSLWAHTLEPIARELGKAMPANAEAFQTRADSLAAEFAALHDWAKRELALIPAGRRVLITAHDAFGYFGRAFDVEVRGLQGVSTATDFGLQDVTNLAEFIAARKIKAVFVESSVPSKPLEAVLEGCRARGHTVAIGGTLYSDAMGDPGTAAGTYAGMFRHNVNTIISALK